MRMIIQQVQGMTHSINNYHIRNQSRNSKDRQPFRSQLDVMRKTKRFKIRVFYTYKNN